MVKQEPQRLTQAPKPWFYCVQLSFMLTHENEMQVTPCPTHFLFLCSNQLIIARRRAEQASFNAEEDYLNLDSGSRKDLPFPAFAYRHFKNRHGIKHMVRSVSSPPIISIYMRVERRTKSSILCSPLSGNASSVHQTILPESVFELSRSQ